MTKWNFTVKNKNKMVSSLPELTKEQEKAICDCIDWIVSVYNKQQKWLNDADLWEGYPFKRTGMNERGFLLILSELKKFNNY